MPSGDNSYHDDSHLNLMGRRPQSALSVSIPTFTRAPPQSFNVSQSFNISETSSISGKLIRIRPSSAAVIIPTAKLNRPMLLGDAVVATYLPATRQGSGALQGTIVAGLPLSTSLPKMSAVKADLVPLGVGSPSIPKRRHPDEEIAMLRKRLRLLEAELKKCVAALHREAERADHGTTREDLERQVAVWDRAKEQWQQEHEAELQRALELLRIELLGTTTQQVEALAAKEKEERIALLRRQSARRLLNAGLAHGWAAWTAANDMKRVGVQPNGLRAWRCRPRRRGAGRLRRDSSASRGSSRRHRRVRDSRGRASR